MRSRIGVIAVLSLTALIIFAPATHAQTNGSPPAGYHPQFNAIRHARRAACSSKSVGTVCKVSLEGQTYSGTCQPTQQGPLACRNLVNTRGQYSY